MTLVRANVLPEILIWARNTAGFHVEEAARKLQVKPERLEQWEAGEVQPTINQLRNMARVYKRPLGVFYLQEIPQGFQVMHDFRHLPGEEVRRFSPELTLELRTAQERRELILDLCEDIDEDLKDFDFAATLDESPEELGLRVREFLGVRYDLQRHWRDPRVAFNAWRGLMESVGVLVLQMASVDSEVVSGFAIAHDRLPIVAVNKKDAFSRRVFSLLHEFVHLALRASGVSDLDDDAERSPEDQRIEVYCNAAAAATLMPSNLFLQEPIITKHPAQQMFWEDAEISELAAQFGVSREAVVRRLLRFGRTTERFYRDKREQYVDEYRQRQNREREKRQDKKFIPNPARDTISINGKPFAHLVLDTYHRDRITLSDASSFLGVRVRHISKIEQYLGIG